jgi:hypothetical protein
MTKRSLDISINISVLLICIGLIFITENHTTGNWVAPGVTIFLLLFLASIQALYLFARIIIIQTKPLNWTLLLSLFILSVSIYLSWTLLSNNH